MAEKLIPVDFGHVVAPTPFVPVRRDLPKKMQYQKWHLLSYLVKLRGTAPKSNSQKTVKNPEKFMNIQENSEFF